MVGFLLVVFAKAAISRAESEGQRPRGQCKLMAKSCALAPERIFHKGAARKGMTPITMGTSLGMS